MKKMRNKLLYILVLTLLFACVLPGLCAHAEFVGTFTKDALDIYYEFYTRKSQGLPIQGVAFLSGSLPAGVAMYWDENSAYITGVPLEEGYYTALFAVATTEAVEQVDLSLSVTDAPAATETPVQGAEIVITKSPTGEYVEAGGSAKFVARANNAERIVWRLVSNDTTNTVRCSEAADYFPGIIVDGLGQETLILSNIPRSLDGWRVEAQFWNGNQHKESYGALITIVDENGNPVSAAQQPVTTPEPFFTIAPSLGGQDLPVDSEARTANIAIQPQSMELVPGESYTLSVLATSPNNGSLSYQWYSAATDNRSAALPIAGASDASYTVNQTDGTAYYWVAVWNTKDGSRSQAVYSDAARVSIAAPATPEPTFTPAPTPVPTPAQRSGASSVSFQLILFGIIGVLALIALIGVVIYLRADARQKAAEAEDERKQK